MADCTTYDAAEKSLTELFVKSKNEVFARYVLANRRQQSATTSVFKCFFCGYIRHPRSRCPAREALCMNCKKKGHYAKVYRSLKQCNGASNTRHSDSMFATLAGTSPSCLGTRVVITGTRVTTGTRAVTTGTHAVTTDTRAVTTDTRAVTTDTRAVTTGTRVVTTDTRAVATGTRVVTTGTRAVTTVTRVVTTVTRVVTTGTRVVTTGTRAALVQ
ncbi:mucin-22-like [Procambarus clarkii]|uniref:mucin-22-like n=1 Tax=Procambarus clarkii TaxID=6728 RepID=UPI0037446A13